MLQIPLVDGLQSRVRTTIGNVSYVFETKYNKRSLKYSLNIEIDNEVIVSGIQLLGGIDIAKYTNLPLSRVYVVNKNYPTKDITEDELTNDTLVVIIEDSDLED